MRTLMPAAIAVSLLCSQSAVADRFDDWLDREVVWIISSREKDRFRKLEEPEEKEGFIEKFWVRRDPTPGTPRNEYREEHYRRLKYAADRFKEGIPGWRTDRGRVYIIHGRPISRIVEQNRVIWRYNSNPNARYYRGPISLVFELGGAVFQSQILSESREALQNRAAVPGQGPVLQDLRPSVSARYRLVNAGPGRSGGIVAVAGETDRYIGDILRSPGEVLEERERDAERRRQALENARETVATRVAYERLALDLGTSVFWTAKEAALFFTVSVPSRQLDFVAAQGVEAAKVDLLCELAAAESDYRVDATEETLAATRLPEQAAALIHRDRFAVPGGRYELSCIATEPSTGRIGHVSAQVAVEPPARDRLQLANLLLSQDVVPNPRASVKDALAFHAIRYGVPASSRFDARLPVYLLTRVYNFRDPAGRLRELVFDYRIYDSERVHVQSPVRPVQMEDPEPRHLPLALVMDLTPLPAGAYHLLLKVVDAETKEFALSHAGFEIAGREPSIR